MTAKVHSHSHSPSNPNSHSHTSPSHSHSHSTRSHSRTHSHSARSEPRDRMIAFESLLDTSRDALETSVEMTALRKLCARSIPDSPSQLRPLAYSLLLGTLPADKRAWRQVTRSQRQRYYALVGTIMNELGNEPPPSDPLAADDALLQRIAKDVERLDLPVLRARTAPSRASPLSPAYGEGGSSSSSSEDQAPENDVRTTPQKRRSRARPPPIPARRQLFARLDCIADALRPPASGKGKEREVLPQVHVQASDQASEPHAPTPDLLSPTSPDGGSGQRTPQLSLTLPQDVDASQPPSPIELLSSQVVSPPPISPPTTAITQNDIFRAVEAHASHLPDTHAEALIRMLFVFCRTCPQWAYGPTFVDIVVPLYLVFCQANVPKGQRDGRSRYAEEETYWAFTALMSELGDVIAGVPGDEIMSSCLQRISARVRWADEPLWNTLKERNLDPGLPLYTFQWLSGLMSHDRANLLPIWDFLFAQPPRVPDMNPKLDLLLDLCVALVVMVKRQVMFAPPRTAPPTTKRDMWHGADVMDIPGEPEDPDAAFVRCLQLFRCYPLKQVGGVWMLLNTAFELNQARRASIIEGVDPDHPAWTEMMDAASNKTSWATASIRAASASTGKLWSSYAQSDAAARMAKASTNLTASAVAKWQAAPAAPDWKGLGAVAGRLFSRKQRDDDQVSVDGEEFEHRSGATTPSHAHSPYSRSPRSAHSPLPHSPISPDKLASLGRQRSDSQVSNSALSVSSLQDKLSGLASTLSVAPRESAPQQQRVTSGPRPLLLSRSVRAAGSRSPRPPSVAGAIPSGSGSGTGITGGLASPPHHEGGHPGLYRIGSRRRPSNSNSRAADSISSMGSVASVIRNKRTSLSSEQSTPYDSDHSYGNLPSSLALSALPENGTPKPSTPTEDIEPISIPTPQISHLTGDDYEHVYEPAEDSFILLDALEGDALMLRDMKPSLCVEIGSGSGIASTFMGTLLGHGEACLISTDINKYAAAATQRTGDANDVALNPVLANLLDPLEARITGNVDLLIFNPPYVVTDDDELVATQNGRDIGGAWAGGSLGMAVTNILLDKLPTLLAPGGHFYLVAIHQNKPDEIIARMRAAGLECKTVIKRRAGRELLSVIRMIRPAAVTRQPLSVVIPNPALHAIPAPLDSGSTITPTKTPPLAAVEPPRTDEKLPADDKLPADAVAIPASPIDGDGEDYDVLLDAYSFMS